MAVQRTLEVVNPEALRTDYAFRVLARIAVRYAFENHLFDDVVEVDNSEQKTKVLDLRPRSDREKFRQIWDESQKKTVIVCRDDRSCYGSKMLRNYKTR